MSDTLIALFIAAGSGGWAYAKLGRRAGYGNTANVWTLVGVTFGLVFISALTMLHFLLHV